jgi:transcriptional regulator with XRE-family HTH domain
MSDDEKRRTRPAAQYGPTAAVVAENVQRFRRRRELSIYQLSAALKKAGRPITPAAVGKIERQQRQVTVDDLMALAVVLQVNPAMLLLPPTIKGDIELSGGVQVPAIKAWDWFRKDMPLSVPEGDDGTAIVEFRLGLPQGIRKFNITNPAGRRAAFEAEEGDADG